MALFTSSPNGKFEITAFSQTPSVISYGDTVTWSITIKNKCGYTINGLALEAYMGYKNAITDAQAQLDSSLANDYIRGYSVQFSFYGSGLNTASISWPNNTERTFTVSRAFDGGENYYTSSVSSVGTINLAEPDLTGRLLQNAPALTAYTNTIYVYYDYVSGKTQYNGNEEAFQGDITNGYSQNLIVFSHTWLPTASLSLQRGLADGTPSDEGERLLLTAQLGKSQYADVSGMACRLYYASGAAPTTASSYVDLTASIAALLAGVTDDVSLVTQTFSNGNDWYFLLWFGDAYESASASASVSRAFANLHLSGASTGGAAFGRFSSSTEGNPKLESEYPAHFYGGIATDCYEPGDTFEIGATNLIMPGIISSSTTTIWFTLYTDKSLANITSISCTKLHGAIRSSSGYINSYSTNAGVMNYAATSGYTVTASKVSNYAVCIVLTKSSAFTNVSNNTPVAFMCNQGITLAFS